MLTGIEIAGAVLAVFPLIISAMEHYDEGMQSMKDWIRFRASFLSFLSALSRQRIFFRQNLEGLLSSAAQSDQEVAIMLDDPKSDLWYSPEIAQRLRDRLSGDYEFEAFVNSATAVRELLQKLTDKLKIVPGEPHWSSKKSSIDKFKLEYEYRRVTYVLGTKRRTKLLSELSRHNEELERLLGNSEKLEPMRRARKSLMPGVFQQIREHAAGLHTALKRAWWCECPDTHETKLLLTRKADHNPQVNLKSALLLSQLSDSNKEQEQVKKRPSVRDRWFAVEVRATQARQAASLRRMSSHQSAPDTASHRTGSVTTDSGDSRKLSVQFSSPATTASSLTSATTLVGDDDDEVRDLCATVNDPMQIRQHLGNLSDGISRRYSLHLALDFPFSSAQTRRILSLDALLEAEQGNGDKMDMPKLSRHNRISIAVTLAHSLLYLHSGPWLNAKWGKRDIYFFQGEDGTVHVDHPFVLANFSSNRPPLSVSNVSGDEVGLSVEATIHCKNSNAALLSLGIVILELWHNRKIEAQSFRSDFLGPDGKENVYTEFMTAMKWQEGALEEAGLDLHNATRRCITCAFGVASQDLCDVELQKAVYDEVVTSMERLLAQFEVPT